MEEPAGWESGLDELHAFGGDLKVRAALARQELLLLQVPGRKQQVLTGDRHELFELQQGQAGLVGIDPAPVVEQTEHAQPAVFLGVDSNFTFQNYVSFITIMMLIFGLAFQTPIAIFFLVKTGLVSIQAMTRSRRFVILGIVVLAAIATPGSDLFSLFSLAIPLYLLFELGIALARLSQQGKLKI